MTLARKDTLIQLFIFFLLLFHAASWQHSLSHKLQMESSLTFIFEMQHAHGCCFGTRSCVFGFFSDRMGKYAYIHT